MRYISLEDYQELNEEWREIKNGIKIIIDWYLNSDKLWKFKTLTENVDFKIIELDAFGMYEKECDLCEGEKYVEYGPVCSQPASNCCGGCYERRECEECEGVGLIDIDYNGF